MTQTWKTPQYLYMKILKFQKDYPDFLFTPLDVFCKNENINLIPYSDKEIKVCAISKDGFCTYIDNSFSIFFNKDKPKTRARFTIAHELAHIYLEHYKYLDPHILKFKKSDCLFWEWQANTFAQNVLIPVKYAVALKPYGTKLYIKPLMVAVRMSKLEQDKKWIESIKFF